MPKKRLAVFLDGTWNDPANNTNVWRLKTMVASRDDDGVDQLAYYDTGVGTKWYEKFRGGLLAHGLSRNVQEAYRWLVEHHDDEDEIFVFGFSRGAYTARSLAGLIAKYGLLVPGSPLTPGEVYQLYSQHKEANRRNQAEDAAADAEDLGELVKRFRKRVRVRFIGIWDTVGTLGIPFGNVPGLSRKQLTFHKTRPSRYFDEGCQALALDEHRGPYDASLWTNFVPVNPKTDEIIESRRATVHFPTFEQRWFVGAHSNVGGGYRQDLLAQVPLKWIQDRAAAAGLHFRNAVRLSGTEHLESEVADSFKDFLKGAYRVLTLNRRHHRLVGRPQERKTRDGKTIGFVETVNETIDPTVIDRWRQNPDYRPKNLDLWAQRTDVELAGLDLTQAIPASS